MQSIENGKSWNVGTFYACRNIRIVFIEKFKTSDAEKFKTSDAKNVDEMYAFYEFF